MRWRDLDLGQQEWRIPETKNGTPHVVPLSEEAITILNKRKPQVPTEYVFPADSKTGHIVAPGKDWRRILERARVEDLRIV
jgi:integrase